MLESFKTDDLLADLQAMKAKIDAQSADYASTYDKYREVIGDLDLMNAKLAFVGGLMRQAMDMVVPDTQEQEKDAMALLFADDSAIGVTKNILWLTTAPLAVTMIADFALYMNWASGTGKVAKFAKASKLFKIVRFGKFAGPVALAIEAIMFVWNEAQAKIINDDLREVLAEAKTASQEATREVTKLKAAYHSAINQRRDLLAEADVTTVEAYVEKLNLAIVDLGRQKVAMSVGRRMLRAGMDHAMILSVVEGMSEPLLNNIAARLKAEVLVAGGSSLAEASEETGLSLAQLDEVRRVIDARDAYMRGWQEDDVLEKIGIPQGTYDEIEETLDTKLAEAWDEIEGSLSVDVLANALILRTAALEDLRIELQAKMRLSNHADIGELASEYAVERDQIVAWASALPLQSEQARRLKQEDPGALAHIAAECRLPMALVAAI